jgi:hypothetical protein
MSCKEIKYSVIARVIHTAHRSFMHFNSFILVSVNAGLSTQTAWCRMKCQGLNKSCRPNLKQGPGIFLEKNRKQARIVGL